jgi:hypothetical protein
MLITKPEEEEERAWSVKTAKMRATTSIVLTLYFCNVSNYQLSKWFTQISSKSQSAGFNNKHDSGAPCHRQPPKKSWSISRFKQRLRRRASGQWRRGSAFANAMISASLPHIRRRRCIRSHAPGSCKAALRAGCLSLRLANACW